MTIALEGGLEFAGGLVQLDRRPLVPVIVGRCVITENTPCEDNDLPFQGSLFVDGVDAVIAFMGKPEKIPLFLILYTVQRGLCFGVKLVPFGQLEHGGLVDSRHKRGAAEFLVRHLSEFAGIRGDHVI